MGSGIVVTPDTYAGAAVLPGYELWARMSYCDVCERWTVMSPSNRFRNPQGIDCYHVSLTASIQALSVAQPFHAQPPAE